MAKTFNVSKKYRYQSDIKIISIGYEVKYFYNFFSERNIFKDP